MPVLFPMLATAGTHVPAGPEWAHEVKWDGIRLLVDCTDDGVRMTTRNGNDRTASWPAIVAHPGYDVLVDGEVVAFASDGRPHLGALGGGSSAQLMVFDLLRLHGQNTIGLPWSARRELLESLDLGVWQLPDVHVDGVMLLEFTQAHGIEGIVSKRRDSAYEPGVRSKNWLKFVHRHRDSYVVGGWRPQVGTADRLASLLVGEMTDSGLAYRGRVGSGISGRDSVALRDMLMPISESPFADEVPRLDAKGTTWVAPTVTVDVESHGPAVHRLRQPSFIAVRTDL